MSKQEYEFHPYAAVLPMLGTADADELAADIQANGLREPIVLLDKKILDGRNRYRACLKVGTEPRFRDFNGDGDPIDYIISVNIKRRHLTQSQKAMVVAKFANLPRGDISRITKTAKTPINSLTVQDTVREKSVAEVAKEVKVSSSTVEQAKRVLKEAPKETIEKVERGEKSVATAVKEIKQTKAKEEQAKTKHVDKTGYTIPNVILEDWKQAESFRSTLGELQRIKVALEKSLDRSELIFREIGQDTLIELKNAWTALKQVLPYAVCPTCQGRTRDKCTVCKQRGFVSEFAYKHWFAKDVIEIRERSIKK